MPRTRGRSCCAISPPGGCSRATTSGPICRSRAGRSRAAICCRARRFLTNNVFEATRGCIHNCEFCVVPAAWGRKPYQKPVEDVVADITPARRAEADLRRSQSDRRSRLRERLFEALIPLRVQWYGLVDRAARRRSAAAGARGAERLPRPADRVRVDSRGQPARSRKGFNKPDAISAKSSRCCTRTASPFRAASCSAWTTTRRTCSSRPRSSPSTPDRSAAVRGRDAVSRHAAVSAARARGPHPDARLGAVRRAARRLSAGADDASRSSSRAPSRRGSYAYGFRVHRRRLRSSPAPLRSRSATNLGYRFYAHNLHRFYNCDWIIGRADARAPRSRLSRRRE